MRAPRAELEQAVLRVSIISIVVSYLIIFAHVSNTRDANSVLIIMSLLLLFSIGVVVRILHNPVESVSRRLIAMVADNTATSYFLAQMGENGAIFLGVYLFITFGNGFRFGRKYLHICQTLAIAGFSIVIFVSPFWSQHGGIAAGFLLGLIVLPFYVGILAERINEARKKADDANEAKGRFLANVSHEMRTPLNGVIAMADVLRETKLDESQCEVVETLSTSAHLLLAQIEDVLDITKIEAGRVHIERRAFDLPGLITGAVKIILPQARYKGLAVSTKVAPKCPRWILGDAHHLRQVLLNLLANAVKFTDKGTIDLSAIPIRSVGDEVTIRFEVRDTGIGIPLAKQAAIFEPFTQADDSISRIYGGTGLGTTIARQLVQLMGGQIALSSVVKAGSTFWFELSFTRTESLEIDTSTNKEATSRVSATIAAIGAARSSPTANAKGARILVAEDNPTNQRVTELILESGGHIPTIVSNGEYALDALEKGGFDLALFDLSMPVVSGLEALKLYRFTTSAPIPVLILSANVTPEIIAACAQAGCAEFVAKPVRPSTLLESINCHLAEQSGPRSSGGNRHSDDKITLSIIDTPFVDSQVLDNLSRLSTDPTFVERLLRGFKSDTLRLVELITSALRACRYSEVKDAAHALKGGAGSVGATQLVQFALRLEKTSEEQLRTKALPLVEQLAQTSKMTLDIFEEHIKLRRQQLGN